jgi:amidase
MSWSEVFGASAVEQAELVREGQLSSEELVQLYLERIAILNPRLSAFVQVFPKRALAAARSKDSKRRRGRGELPVFHGVPIAIKDLNVVRWMPTRFGTRATPHPILPIDDRTVATLRRAGFVILGKLATSELGAMPVTEPDIHPPTRNPWAPEHSAGGSSGGSGAAVAAAMLPVAQGSDGAGSIRIPAAFCHLVGLKPSRGRLKNQFGLKDRRVLYTSGALTRTVDDAAAMLDVMAGLEEGRPHWAPRPPRPFRELAGEQPHPMKIRFTTCSPLGPTHPEIAVAVERAARVLGELGHGVEEGPPHDGTLEEFLPLFQHLTAQIPLTHRSRLQPITGWLVEPGRKLHARDMDALHARLEARFQPLLAQAELWVTPTVAQPPPLIGSVRDLPPAEAFADAAQLGAFTALANITGQPAISLPLGLTTDGLPIGVQLAGALFTEGELLAVARQLEDAMPWKDRRAPELQ